MWVLLLGGEGEAGHLPGDDDDDQFPGRLRVACTHLLQRRLRSNLFPSATRLRTAKGAGPQNGYEELRGGTRPRSGSTLFKCALGS
ncbi:hypothetical protein HPB52_020749 [Rhipicephalus sanguineus]|uniref:Uncharacterized protein n=1 Tax=Rhipicephalus sanguineus TaxID=34632 RepID=A0A9D4T852_RHISA|nr:hypothetical protein HPB52_020749 [Rhipicephalus sanguineus]